MEVVIANSSPITKRSWLIIGAVCICLLFLPNGIYLLVCALTLLTIVSLLWRIHRPGISSFSLMMQWTQVVTYVIWMDFTGNGMDRGWSRHGGAAVLFSCMGLMVITVVFSRGIRTLKIPSRKDLEEWARPFNQRKILALYIFSTLFLGSLGFALGAGFAQILITIRGAKWIFFLLYGYLCYIRKKNYSILVLIILFEFTTGLVSYFSDFKEVLLYTFILTLTFIKKISGKQVLYGLFSGVALIFIMITWTAIKGDYRNYLNQGQHQQVVAVSKSDAFSHMGEQIKGLSWEKYQMALNLMFLRLQYIMHLAITMDRVPDVLPHEYGNVWWENVSFVIMPRILFPNKPIYEATVKTRKYTGINYAGFQQGASFSLGYFADSYIDFGYLGMFVPLALIALYVVFIYRSFYKLTRVNLLLRYALINVSLYQFCSFEADGLYMFGRLTSSFLVFWIIGRTLLPRLQNWMYK